VGNTWTDVGGGVYNTVLALLPYDDGSGLALYVGGDFYFFAGGVPANRIARWDGQGWSAVGNGVTQTVVALAVFDDGTGSALYAGGPFGSRLSRWDGTTWSDFAYPNQDVYALAAFDDGTGPALYVGGLFTSIGGHSIPRLARWDGQHWSGVGNYVPHQTCLALGVVGGPLPALYAGFTYDSLGFSDFIRWGCTTPPTPACYPNCDSSTTPPILNVEDFTCFITEFASALNLPPAQQLAHYANCDQSTTTPILNVEDFTCFINQFAQGCP
jgi:hypothetical protein